MNCWKNITQQPIAKRLKRAQVVRKDRYCSHCISRCTIKVTRDTTYLSSMQLESRQIRETLLGERVLEHDGRPDLQVLVHEDRAITRLTAQFGECQERVIIAFLHQQPAWRVWEEQHPNAQDDGWNNLNGQGKTPRRLGLAGAASSGYILVGVEGRTGRCAAGVGDIGGAASAADVVGTIVDPVANQDANGDGHWAISRCWKRERRNLRCCATTRPPRIPAIETCCTVRPSTTLMILGGKYLRDVERHYHGKHTDCEAGNCAT